MNSYYINGKRDCFPNSKDGVRPLKVARNLALDYVSSFP